MWYARGHHSFAAIATAQHPDGVEVPVEPADCVESTMVWQAERHHQVWRLSAIGAAPGSLAERCWFVHLHRTRSDGRPAQVLLAFDATVVLAGSIIDNNAFTPLPVRSDEQLGAIRFDAARGHIDEVMVHPSARRQGLARALVFAAGAVQILENRGPALRGGELLTDDGQGFVSSLVCQERIEPRTAVGRLNHPALRTS